MRRGALVASAMVVLAACSSSSTPSADDLRHTIQVGYGEQADLGPWPAGVDPSLAAAIANLGRPSSCRTDGRYSFAIAEWRTLGVRAEFGSYGSEHSELPPCEQIDDMSVDSAVFTGWRWRLPRGLRIGDSEATFHRLFPSVPQTGADEDALALGRHPVGTGWVLIPSPNEFQGPRLVVRIVDGEVTAFVVTLMAQGE